MSDDIEKFKREFEIWKTQEQHKLETWKGELEVWKAQMLRETAIYQNVNMQGQGAMKAALFINGGASVALLAFVGTTVGKDMESTLLLALCFSMLLFIIGTLLAAIASGVTYLAGLVGQSSSDEEKINKWKFWRHWCFYNVAAIMMVILSYVLFIISSLNAYFAFTGIVE